MVVVEEAEGEEEVTEEEENLSRVLVELEEEEEEEQVVALEVAVALRVVSLVFSAMWRSVVRGVTIIPHLPRCHRLWEGVSCWHPVVIRPRHPRHLYRL